MSTTDERRRAILHCASRLFRHYGHAKTTIAEIAREANVGVGTVYLAFPSKEAIVEELSSSAHVRVLVAMRTVAQDRRYDGFGERLTGVLETRVATFHELKKEGEHACDLVTCTSGPVKSVHARFREEEATILREIFEDARESGEIDATDLTRAIGLVQRAYASLSPPWVFELAAEDARRTAYEMARLLLLGLCARGNERAGARAGAGAGAGAGARRKTRA